MVFVMEVHREVKRVSNGVFVMEVHKGERC